MPQVYSLYFSRYHTDQWVCYEIVLSYHTRWPVWYLLKTAIFTNFAHNYRIVSALWGSFRKNLLSNKGPGWHELYVIWTKLAGEKWGETQNCIVYLPFAVRSNYLWRNTKRYQHSWLPIQILYKSVSEQTLKSIRTKKYFHSKKIRAECQANSIQLTVNSILFPFQRYKNKNWKSPDVSCQMAGHLLPILFLEQHSVSQLHSDRV